MLNLLKRRDFIRLLLAGFLGLFAGKADAGEEGEIKAGQHLKEAMFWKKVD